MKLFLKSLLILGLISGLTACADHQFSELKKTSEVASGDIEDPVDPPPPVEPPPVEPPPVDPPPVEPPPVVVHKGPEILWVQVPNTALAVGDVTTIVYQVVAGTSPVVKISCVVDSKSVPCQKDGDTLQLKDLAAGLHHLQITATDANDLQDSDGVDWEVVEKFQKVKMPLAISDGDDQVDVLFVIDNSRSMIDEQKNMAEKITNFMDRVKGLDWRIGIVTTDFTTNVYGQGKLLKYPNQSYFLTSAMDIEEARKQFGKTIQRSESGDSVEQGIRATYKALARAFSGAKGIDEQHKAFFRKDAALAVVVISDEDESAKATENLGSNLISSINTWFGPQKMFKFHSIIVRPGDSACKSASIDHRYGQAYADLTKLTGGVLGNICTKDYGNQLEVIGQDVANTQNTFALACVPKDIDGDGVADVKVTASSGSVKVPNFVIKGDTIVFSSAPKAGNYSVDYFCPKK